MTTKQTTESLKSKQSWLRRTNSVSKRLMPTLIRWRRKLSTWIICKQIQAEMEKWVISARGKVTFTRKFHFSLKNSRIPMNFMTFHVKSWNSVKSTLQNLCSRQWFHRGTVELPIFLPSTSTFWRIHNEFTQNSLNSHKFH